ncbi:hypothetical protein FIV42_16445 [Persicimonas caeni]|uniref:HEAT repeat domain-containing protein n=1 Tax=Persicimonas caeni TaxID=2292766 RepID=A0A4Y6PVX6_PERCE|nr:hypothetical protein [Persicimonas caeni]QDG52269.1 hypothetical protein FIV42_16445 [Persicimonas caeni]QED33491.1 hypothetical protein FRD00_16440 [Persicimonas caeni]
MEPDEELGLPLLLTFDLDDWDAMLTVIFEPQADLWWGHLEGPEAATAQASITSHGDWLDTAGVLAWVERATRSTEHRRAAPFLLARAAPESPEEAWIEAARRLLSDDDPLVREAMARGLIEGVSSVATTAKLQPELETIADADPCDSVRRAARLALDRAEEPRFEVPRRFRHFDTSNIDDTSIKQRRAVFRDQDIHADDFAVLAQDVGMVWDGSTHTAHGFEARSEFWTDPASQVQVAFVDDPIMGVAFLVIRGDQTRRVAKLLEAAEVTSADELLEAYQSASARDLEQRFSYLRQLICALEPRRAPKDAIDLLVSLVSSPEFDEAYAAITALDYCWEDRLARAIGDRLAEERRPKLRRQARDVLDRYLSKLERLRRAEPD